MFLVTFRLGYPAYLDSLGHQSQYAEHRDLPCIILGFQDPGAMLSISGRDATKALLTSQQLGPKNELSANRAAASLRWVGQAAEYVMRLDLGLGVFACPSRFLLPR